MVVVVVSGVAGGLGRGVDDERELSSVHIASCSLSDSSWLPLSVAEHIAWEREMTKNRLERRVEEGRKHGW